MTHFYSSPKLLAKIFWLFTNLTITSKHRVVLSQSGVVEQVLTALECYDEDEELQLRAVMLLSNLSLSREIREEIFDGGAMFTLLAILEQTSCPELAIRCGVGLCKLLRDNTSRLSDGERELVEQVLRQVTKEYAVLTLRQSVNALLEEL